MRKYLILLFLILLINPINSANLLTCRISNGTLSSNICNSDESSMNFFINKNQFPTGQPLEALSAKTSVNFDLNYNKGICCKINLPNYNKLVFDSSTIATNSCQSGFEEVVYFDSLTNSKLAFINGLGFNQNNYQRKLCVKVPTQFSNFDILVSDINYAPYGYECLFKTNDLTNAVLSSCDAISPITYTYTVWGRLWEDVSSLKCSTDCTSKLDGRVYDLCSQKVSSCENIPISCNGALKGSIVNYNSTHDLKCEKSWNNFIKKTFTDNIIKVESNNSSCKDLLKKKYSVILNNELVTMNIYICRD